jgi:predicted amidophosphoribosyltransferase
MVCLVCTRVGEGHLCPSCRLLMRPAPERLAGRVVVRPALIHTGPARTLVHMLKYRGILAAAEVLAHYMAHAVSPGSILVPVPRVRWRVVRYGVDPALELAVALARITGASVSKPLRAAFFGGSRAAGAHGFSPRFRVAGPLFHQPVLLVDDVVTTGTTVTAAARALGGSIEAVAATSGGGRVKSPTRAATTM